MTLRGTHTRLGAGIVAGLAACALAVSASPASANMDDGWVRGYDTYVGDWGDEGELYRDAGPFGHVSTSNAVCLWQRVLWAEGAKKTQLAGKPSFTTSDINGVFDYDTYYATADLQRTWRIGVDTRVGKTTFGRADNQLSKTGGSTDRGKTLYLKYDGASHDFNLRRNTEGKYLFQDADGDWRQAGYDYRTCG
ncbi:Tat pathway signal protein [Streptomyces sp. ID05-39B]|uniref:Tat pathway signal protein n=1 Tax=Streptomyces sp. ID05-39B TaxID=3028664 RepID=UPI0029A2E3EB|nr:Tat pathway signal protein [Streptomyces sp. ID05-39B]MDX3531789.1 Tat pathway signal protein [Streptomyces sp. ID05-39B]